MLKSLALKNFTVFPSAHFEFSPGINAFIGENSTGKTHVLKIAYALNRAWSDLMNNRSALSTDRANAYFEERLIGLFLPGELSNLIRREASECRLTAQIGAFIPTLQFKMPDEADPWPTYPYGHAVEDLLWDLAIANNGINLKTIPEAAPVNAYVLNSIFIPSKEIVSLYDGLIGLFDRYKISLDATYRDLANAINSPELKNLPAWFSEVFADLENDLDGVLKLAQTKLVFEGKRGAITETPMMAEGHRKLALLMYLVRHDVLQRRGETLFWDEPEANLNPKLMAKLAQVLVALASKGIQINLATHSLFLLKELDLQLHIAAATKPVPAKFFALSDDGDGVQVNAGDGLEQIEPIVALDMEINQADRYNEWLYQAAEKSG